MTSMALALGRRGDRQARSLQMGAVAGMAAGLLILLAFALVSARYTSPEPFAEAVTAQQLAVDDWETAVHPLILTGSEVVALGPRTGVADLAQHKVPDAQMRTMATGWVQRLSELRAQIAAVTTPPSLRGAHDLLDTAMAGYVTASRDLASAAAATGPRRDQLLADAATAGKTADQNFDLAAATIARLRADLKLPTDWSAS